MEYQSLHSTAERFADELSRQLNELIQQNKLALGVPIERRVKTWGSIEGKIERKFLPITNIKELDDLIGLRIILLFKKDVETVCNFIRSAFHVVAQEDTQHRLADSQFGYSSIHLLIEFPKDWLSVPTLSQLSGLRAEVQVRTVAQHIWAMASHTLQYKHESNVPISVRRSINRVAALLETVDLEFERVLETRHDYKVSIGTSKEIDILNVDSLEAIIDELLPAENKDVVEDYADLLSDLTLFSIHTVGNLKSLIQKHINSVLKEDKERVRKSLKKIGMGAMLDGSIIDRIDRGIFFTHAGLVRGVLEHEFGELWRERRKKKTRKKKKEKE